MRAIIYVTTLANGIMEAMAQVECTIIAATRKHHERRTHEGGDKKQHPATDEEVCFQVKLPVPDP